MSNTETYHRYIDQIETKLSILVKELFADVGVVDRFYALNTATGDINERMIHEFYCPPRIILGDLRETMSKKGKKNIRKDYVLMALGVINAPDSTLLDCIHKNQVMANCLGDNGKIDFSLSVRLRDFYWEKKYIRFSHLRSELEERSAECKRKALRRRPPNDDEFRCDYCKLSTLNSQAVYKTIHNIEMYGIGGGRMKFCSSECALSKQCSTEG